MGGREIASLYEIKLAKADRDGEVASLFSKIINIGAGNKVGGLLYGRKRDCFGL
jgi:hypothetical protein